MEYVSKVVIKEFRAIFNQSPRFFAGFLSCLLFLIILIHEGYGLFFSFAINLSWFLGLLLGGKYRLLFKLLLSLPTSLLDKGMYWGFAFWGGLLSVSLLTYLVYGISEIKHVLAAISAPFSLCYGICKLGCHQFKCCGWNSPINFFGYLVKVPLQLIEVYFSFFIFILTLIIFVVNPFALLPFCLFILSHGLIRCFSVLARGKVKSFIPIIGRLDSGLILVLGLCLLIIFRH